MSNHVPEVVWGHNVLVMHRGYHRDITDLEGLIYFFFKCSSTNFCTSSLSFLESRYTLALLGLKFSFTSIC